MVMFVSKRNQRILAASPMSGDFVHDCTDEDDAMSKEDVLIISDTVEEDGVSVSTGKLKGDIMYQGVSNKASTRSRIEGTDIDSVTRRGNNAENTRARTYYEYINKI